GGVGNRGTNRIWCHEEKAGGNVSKASVERGAVSDLGILRSGKSGGFSWRWRLRTVKTRLTLVFRGGQAYVLAGSESTMEIPVKISKLDAAKRQLETVIRILTPGQSFYEGPADVNVVVRK